MLNKKRKATTQYIRLSSEYLDPRDVGGKLAKQQEMKSHGIDVPDFFCVTKELYKEMLSSIKAPVEKILTEIDFSDAESVHRASQNINGLFRHVTPKEVQIGRIYGAFDKIFENDDYVAVRASTVGHLEEESEDSAKNPFAGMSETFLYVKREQVVSRILECFASGFSAESLIYRHAQGMDLLGFDVAVAVQKMIIGEKSFVLFTANPITASKDPVIAAGYGCGEGVVQEKVPVDHYFVSQNAEEIRREIVQKSTKMELDHERGFGLKITRMDKNLMDVPCLSDDEINRIVEKGRIIAGLFESPQDIEGCIDKEGKIHFLQSRPIAYDYEKMRVWTNANVTESFPGVTTALTYSVSRYFYRVIFRHCYRMLGISEEQLNGNHEILDRMIGYLEGRVYYNLTSFYHLHRQVPLFPIFRAHWEKMMGFRSSYQTEESRGISKVLSKVAETGRVGRGALTVLYRFVKHDRAIRDFHQWWDKLAEPVKGRDFSEDDPLYLVGEFYRIWGEVGRNWGITLLNDSYLPLLYGVTEQIFAKWGLQKDGSLLPDLLCGDEQLLSVEIVLSVVRLSERARMDHDIAAVFQERTNEEILVMLKNRGLSKDFTDAVEEHLYRYGDRGLAELKMEQPNTRHTPQNLIQSIKNYIKIGATEAEMKAQEAKVRREGEKRLKEALKGERMKIAFVKLLLLYLRKLIRYRENSRYCRSELFGFTKNLFRGIGVQFQTAGILEEWSDIYHLSMDEIFGLIDGSGVTKNLKGIAEIRKREFEHYQDEETPIEVTTYGPLYANPIRAVEQNDSATGELRGLGSSSGKVRGRARVVKDPRTISNIDEDTILVAKETDPGWMFLMLASRGIVVECGSMLSHTAITGRKFGIPTIVSVPMATTRIPDGALLEMDGSTGQVTILDSCGELG